MERQLATIQKILEINPIEGADKIEVATILGWEVVVKKGEFKVGDLCVYIEIDSLLPVWEEFEFMEKKKYRVKTIRLRKQISQGLAFPISAIKKVDLSGFTEGQNVTKELKIIKYDPQLQKENKLKNTKPVHPVVKYFLRYEWFRKLYNQKKSDFPSFLRKTDETRIQSKPSVLRRDKDIDYVFTEKLDGQSATFAIKKKFFGYEYFICSRNLRLVDKDTSNYWKIFEQENLKEKLKRIHKLYGDVAIQGEIIGNGIQGNKYGIDGLEFHVFSLFGIKINNYMKSHGRFNIKDHSYLSHTHTRVTCDDLGLNHVPVLKKMVKLPETVKELVEISKGDSVLKKGVVREGIVCRHYDDSNYSFKVINPEFLLKNKE